MELGHITVLIPDLLKFANNNHLDNFFCTDHSLMHIQSGQVLGYALKEVASNIDFGVYNSTHIQSFINKNRFNSVKKFIHSDCPYDYYPSNLKSRFYDLFGPKPLNQPKSCRGARGVEGTIAGPWFDTKEVHLPAFEQTQGSPVIIGTIMNGNIRIVRGNELQIHRENLNHPTNKDPVLVTNEHCYEVESGGYFFFQLQPDGNILVARNENGICPGSFPDSGYKLYYR